MLSDILLLFKWELGTVLRSASADIDEFVLQQDLCQLRWACDEKRSPICIAWNRELRSCSYTKRSPAVTYTKSSQYTDPILVQCWATVCDAGPTLNQHWVSVLVYCVCWRIIACIEVYVWHSPPALKCCSYTMRHENMDFEEPQT